MPLARRDFIKMLGLVPLVGMFVRVGSARPAFVTPKEVNAVTAKQWQEAREYRGLVRLAQEPHQALNRLMNDAVYSGGGAGGATDAASGMQFMFHTKRVSLDEFKRAYPSTESL